MSSVLSTHCTRRNLPYSTQAHSLYVRAAASGLHPRTTALLPAFPLTADDVDDDGGNTDSNARRDAEISLLVTAARAHIAMGGVLDGLALIDDATDIGGGFGGGAAAAAALRARGKWGGDGAAGGGLARLGDGDASAVAEELCVSGGSVGLRAALRLRERLLEEVTAVVLWLDRVRAGQRAAGEGGWFERTVRCEGASVFGASSQPNPNPTLASIAANDGAADPLLSLPFSTHP